MFKFSEKVPPVNSEVLVHLKNIKSPDISFKLIQDPDILFLHHDKIKSYLLKKKVCGVVMAAMVL